MALLLWRLTWLLLISGKVVFNEEELRLDPVKEFLYHVTEVYGLFSSKDLHYIFLRTTKNNINS